MPGRNLRGLHSREKQQAALDRYAQEKKDAELARQLQEKENAEFAPDNVSEGDHQDAEEGMQGYQPESDVDQGHGDDESTVVSEMDSEEYLEDDVKQTNTAQDLEGMQKLLSLKDKVENLYLYGASLKYNLDGVPFLSKDGERANGQAVYRNTLFATEGEGGHSHVYLEPRGLIENTEHPVQNEIRTMYDNLIGATQYKGSSQNQAMLRLTFPEGSLMEYYPQDSVKKQPRYTYFSPKKNGKRLVLHCFDGNVSVHEQKDIDRSQTDPEKRNPNKAENSHAVVFKPAIAKSDEDALFHGHCQKDTDFGVSNIAFIPYKPNGNVLKETKQGSDMVHFKRGEEDTYDASKSPQAQPSLFDRALSCFGSSKTPPAEKAKKDLLKKSDKLLAGIEKCIDKTGKFLIDKSKQQTQPNVVAPKDFVEFGPPCPTTDIQDRKMKDLISRVAKSFQESSPPKHANSEYKTHFQIMAERVTQSKYQKRCLIRLYHDPKNQELKPLLELIMPGIQNTKKEQGQEPKFSYLPSCFGGGNRPAGAVNDRGQGHGVQGQGHGHGVQGQGQGHGHGGQGHDRQDPRERLERIVEQYGYGKSFMHQGQGHDRQDPRERLERIVEQYGYGKSFMHHGQGHGGHGGDQGQGQYGQGGGKGHSR